MAGFALHVQNEKKPKSKNKNKNKKISSHRILCVILLRKKHSLTCTKPPTYTVRSHELRTHNRQQIQNVIIIMLLLHCPVKVEKLKCMLHFILIRMLMKNYEANISRIPSCCFVSLLLFFMLFLVFLRWRCSRKIKTKQKINK